MATPQWSQLTFLTAAQQAKLADFATIGAALNGKGPPPDISSVTYSQAKAADTALRSLQDLVGPAVRGAQYVRDRLKQAQIDAFDAANP